MGSVVCRNQVINCMCQMCEAFYREGKQDKGVCPEIVQRRNKILERNVV